jgi:hypothetical protein
MPAAVTTFAWDIDLQGWSGSDGGFWEGSDGSLFDGSSAPGCLAFSGGSRGSWLGDFGPDYPGPPFYPLLTWEDLGVPVGSWVTSAYWRYREKGAAPSGPAKLYLSSWNRGLEIYVDPATTGSAWDGTWQTVSRGYGIPSRGAHSSTPISFIYTTETSGGFTRIDTLEITVNYIDPPSGYALLESGNTQLGVRRFATLGFPTDTPSLYGQTQEVGLRYLKPGVGAFENLNARWGGSGSWSIADLCVCSDFLAYGSAVWLDDTFASAFDKPFNLSETSFTADAVSATSVCETGTDATGRKARITHHFHYAGSDTWVCDVTIENIGTHSLCHLGYKRGFAAQSESTAVQSLGDTTYPVTSTAGYSVGWGAAGIKHFGPIPPTVPALFDPPYESYADANGSFSGGGGTWELELGYLGIGESKTFRFWLGVGDSTASSEALLAGFGADLKSLWHNDHDAEGSDAYTVGFLGVEAPGAPPAVPDGEGDCSFCQVALDPAALTTESPIAHSYANSYAAEYLLTFPPGTNLVTVNSPDFGPVLALYDPSDLSAYLSWNGDRSIADGGSGEANLCVTVVVETTYLVEVSTWNDFEVGAFTLKRPCVDMDHVVVTSYLSLQAADGQSMPPAAYGDDFTVAGFLTLGLPPALDPDGNPWTVPANVPYQGAFARFGGEGNLWYLGWSIAPITGGIRWEVGSGATDQRMWLYDSEGNDLIADQAYFIALRYRAVDQSLVVNVDGGSDQVLVLTAPLTGVPDSGFDELAFGTPNEAEGTPSADRTLDQLGFWSQYLTNAQLAHLQPGLTLAQILAG